MSIHLKRAERLLTEARALHQAAETRGGDLTTEERSQYNSLMTEARQAAADAEGDHELHGLLVKFQGGKASTEFRSVSQGGTTPVERRTGDQAKATAVLVPSTAEYRAQAEGTDSAGGYTVPVEVSSIVIDRMRPQSVFLKAGPRLFVMQSDQLSVPKIGASATVSMVAENAEITTSDITFASALFTARKLAGLVRASNEWMSDSVPDARLVVEQDLLREMGTVLDAQLFAGSGVAPNITGLVNVSGVTATAIDGAITLDAISEAIQRIQVDNGTPNAIFLSPAVWGTVQRLKDSDLRYQLRPDPSMDARQQLFGVPVYIAPAVDDVAIVADMSQVGVGVRDRMSVHYDPFRYSEFDQVAIRVTSRWDLQVLNEAAVELLTGVA